MARALLLFFLIATTGAAASDTGAEGEATGNLRTKDLAYWKARLDAEQFEVCRQGGTERPFSGRFATGKHEGTFVCSSCGQELFDSQTKYDSGTGWPSFWTARPAGIELHPDHSFFMNRTEVRCSRCGAHLGHVFDDGPLPTGKRYCINSVCLRLVPKSAIASESPASGRLRGAPDSSNLRK